MLKHDISIGSALADFGKDIGKALIRGFGRIFGIGIAAGVFGGGGAGLYAALNGGPVVGFAIGGAVVSVIAVYGIWLFAMSDY